MQTQMHDQSLQRQTLLTPVGRRAATSTVQAHPRRAAPVRVAGAALRRPVRSRHGPVEHLMVHTGLLFAFFVVTAMLPSTAFPWAWLPIVVANLIVLRGMQIASRTLWREWRAAARSQ